MLRDMELVREILLALEAKPGPEVIETVNVEGYDDLAVRYHLILLAQAKLIDYEPVLTKTGRVIRVLAFNLSWQGYEFLDAVRDEAVWGSAPLFTDTLLRLIMGQEGCYGTEAEVFSGVQA